MAGSTLKAPTFPTGICVDAGVLGGMPVLSGTRIPVATIAAYLRAKHTLTEIRADYPSLPEDGIAVVEAWARSEYGENWKSAVAVRRA